MSQFRQNIVTGDWIIMAPERAKRPDQFLPPKAARKVSPKKDCPFEDLKKTGNWPPILAYPNEEKWEIVVIPNKYPALVHKHGPTCDAPYEQGPYHLLNGSGHHDLLVTREHDKDLTKLSVKAALRIFLTLQERYRQLATDKCLQYTSAFFNFGPGAGASLFHPHYQILTLPIIPHDIRHSLQGSHEYYKKNKECVHCTTIKYEHKSKKRIVDENDRAIAFAPYASSRPFEIRVFPKKHYPCFEHASEADLEAVVVMLQSVLKRVARHLNDPDLNFYIHSAPLKQQNHYHFYHWHIEVIPKIHPPPGGFEVSTGVNINVIEPERAAAMLRGKRAA